MNKISITIAFEQTNSDGTNTRVERVEERFFSDPTIFTGIDSCEKAVLETAYSAMRSAVSAQLSAASKKKARLSPVNKIIGSKVK